MIRVEIRYLVPGRKDQKFRPIQNIADDIESEFWGDRFFSEAYKKLDETRPSGLFGRHSLSQELIEYITAPTFKEAIYGKKE